MNKHESSKGKYCVQWENHSKHTSTVICSLMEHQSLVDLAICCGTNTIHAHKCILAANSPYFREQLEKNTGTEQIMMVGLDFAVVKSIIEFMYCGQTNILDENLKHTIAAARFFKMRGLQTLVTDHHNVQIEVGSINIPHPIFLPKKPKYPNAHRPVNNTAPAPPHQVFNSFKNPIRHDSYLHKKIKHKFVRSEAEKACAKEAAASRLALEALQKELATQNSSFVIEESCTETTVENFIPHTDESYIENLNNVENVPLQVVNYDELNGSVIATNQLMKMDKLEHPNTTKDKLKRILGAEIPGNVEIMYRTSDGNFVTVTDDVFQNLSDGTLQYQIFDENGQVGEIREIQMQALHSAPLAGFQDLKVPTSETSVVQSIIDSNEANPEGHSLNITNSYDVEDRNSETLLHSNESMPEIVELYIGADGNINSQHVEPQNSINLAPSGSSSLHTNMVISSTSKIQEADPLISIIHGNDNDSQLKESSNLKECDVSRFLNLDDVSTTQNANVPEEKTDYHKSNTEESCNFSDPMNSSYLPSQYDEPVEEWYPTSTEIPKQNLVGEISLIDDVDATSKTLENGSDDYGISSKKMKLGPTDATSTRSLSMPSIEGEEVPWKMLEDGIEIVEIPPPRKTRSSLRNNETASEECKIVTNNDDQTDNPKYEKPRRVMPRRKKRSI